MSNSTHPFEAPLHFEVSAIDGFQVERFRYSTPFEIGVTE
jgi:hypothetical protein